MILSMSISLIPLSRWMQVESKVGKKWPRLTLKLVLYWLFSVEYLYFFLLMY